MTAIDVTRANRNLADLAAKVTRSLPQRTPQRRAAAALFAALVTTTTPLAALEALSTFARPAEQDAAAGLLGTLMRDPAAAADVIRQNTASRQQMTAALGSVFAAA